MVTAPDLAPKWAVVTLVMFTVDTVSKIHSQIPSLTYFKSQRRGNTLKQVSHFHCLSFLPRIRAREDFCSGVLWRSEAVSGDDSENFVANGDVPGLAILAGA